MKLSKAVNKRIATEILLFFSGILIWCFLAASIVGYNVYEKNTYDRLTRQEFLNNSSLDSAEFIPPNDVIEVSPDKKNKKPKVDLSVLDESKQKGTKANGEEVLLPLPPPYKDYIRKDSIEKAFVSKLKLENAKIDQELPKHYGTDGKSMLEVTAFLLLLMLYPVRFLFIIIRWALKTVREVN